jgi:hypothetical protein
MQSVKTFVRAVVTLSIALVLASCSTISPLAPVPAEVPLIAGELKEPIATAGQSFVVIFNNGSKLLHGIDNTARINVRINGKGVGGLDIGQYVQLSLPNGTHRVELAHRDVVLFKSAHELVLTGAPAYVEIAATILSNDMKVHDRLPTGNYLPQPWVPYLPR